MKITHNFFDTRIDFDENDIWSLIIENSKKYYELSNELYKQCNGDTGGFALTDKLEELSFSKTSLFIYDVYNFNINSSKVDKILNSMILEKFTEKDFMLELNEINKKIIELNDKILEDIDLPIEFDDEFNSDKFIKLSSYKISEDKTLLERICTYIDLMVKLKKIKVVILVNFFNFFCEEDMLLLLKQITYMDIKILLINPNMKYKIENSSQIIVDEDLCFI